EAAHDLAAPRPRQRLLERDLLGRNDRAQALAGKAEQLAAERVARLVAALERNEGLDDLHRDGIGFADHARLGDRGMLHEGALDLEGPDEVPHRLDDVVRAPDEPEVAVPVAPGEVPRQVEAAHEALPVAFLLAPVAPEHGGPAGAEGQLALDVGGLDHLDAILPHAADDCRLDAGQRAPHRPRPDVHGGEVRDHDAARL